MATKSEQAIHEIVGKHRIFLGEICGIHEDYLFQTFYLPKIHKLVQKDKLPVFNFEGIYSDIKEPFKKDFIYGVINRQERRTVPEQALLRIVSVTLSRLSREDFCIARNS